MATNMYLKFEEPDIRADIEVLSWSHGFTQPPSHTRGSAEQAIHQNLTFTKYLDSSTNELLKHCWSGQPFGKVTLTCFRSDGAAGNRPVEYLRVTMQKVIIANLSVSGGPGDIPVESVSLEYGIIEYRYTEQKHSDLLNAAPAAVTHDLTNHVVQ